MSIEQTLERIALALESLAGTGIIQQGAKEGVPVGAALPTPRRRAAAATAAASSQPAETAGAALSTAAEPAQQQSQPTVIAASHSKQLTVNAPVTSITRDQIGEVVTNLINGGQRPAVLAIFKKVGATNISTIPVDKYAEVVAEGNMLLGLTA